MILFDKAGAERMWKFSINNQLNIKQLANSSEFYLYDVIMNDEISTMFIIATEPISCAKVQ
jgi:hypothetical protein